MKKLNELIAKCVLGNVVFEGTVGSAYTVQELVHQTKLPSINKMYQNTRKQIASLEADSLFANPSSTKRRALELQADVLEAVFTYKQELAAAAKAREEQREKNVRMIAKLKDIKETKEIEALEAKSPEEIDALLAELGA